MHSQNKFPTFHASSLRALDESMRNTGTASPGFGPVGPVMPEVTPGENEPASPGFGPVGPVTPEVPPQINTPASPGFGPIGPVTPEVPPQINTPASPGFGPIGPVTPEVPPQIDEPAAPGFGPIGPVTPEVTPGENEPAGPGMGPIGSVMPELSFVNRLAAYVRFFHSSIDTEPFHIYVNGRLTVSYLDYGSFSGYFVFFPGTYSIVIYRARNTKVPILNTRITVQKNMVYTAAIMGTPAFHSLELIGARKQEVPHDQARIRFIHLASNTPAVDVMVDGQTLYSNLMYTDATEYFILAPGIHSIILKRNNSSIFLFDEPKASLRSGSLTGVYLISKRDKSSVPDVIFSNEMPFSLN